MRVGILSLIHESNTFAATPTTLDLFQRDQLLIGDEVRREYEGGHNQLSGFLEGLAGTDIEAVPIFHASTPPSGTITRATCDELLRLMFAALDDAGDLDGFLVSPHGANAGEGDDYRDLDGCWLARLRARVGPDRPIICVIDPHANLSQRMVDCCDATIAYRSNPHLDQKNRGLEAAALIARTLRGEIRPVQRASFPLMGINIERQGTTVWPCLPLYELANAQLAHPGVLTNSIVQGFPYADVEEMGSSAIAVTNGDADMAQQLADELTAYLVEHRAEFVGEYIAVEEAVACAVAIRGLSAFWIWVTMSVAALPGTARSLPMRFTGAQIRQPTSVSTIPSLKSALARRVWERRSSCRWEAGLTIATVIRWRRL